MALIRVYSKMDSNHKIAFPRGIRKALDIKPGDKLELTVIGVNKVRKMIVSKTRGPSPHSVNSRRLGTIFQKAKNRKCLR